jgi:hypothetical protein
MCCAHLYGGTESGTRLFAHLRPIWKFFSWAPQDSSMRTAQRENFLTDLFINLARGKNYTKKHSKVLYIIKCTCWFDNKDEKGMLIYFYCLVEQKWMFSNYTCKLLKKQPLLLVRKSDNKYKNGSSNLPPLQKVCVRVLIIDKYNLCLNVTHVRTWRLIVIVWHK